MRKTSLSRRVAGMLFLSVGLRAAAAAPLPDLPFTRFTLPNGLTVVVHEDHKAPVVAVGVWYHVGSADEPDGKAGFAHLFEHLMFSGSAHYRHSYLPPFEQAGASDLNGTTSFDRTNYYETVPTTALDMALWMESDRMGYLLGAIGPKALDTQRGVVQNEKRQGENQPHGRVYEQILAASFPRNHPYHHDPIGSMADLDAASLADVQRWFRAYYGAANATLVLAGDVTPAEARAKAERYFGEIPAGPPVPRQQPWVTPLLAAQRGVQRDHVSQTSFYRTWVIPQLGTDDAVRLDLAAAVLGGGDTSRLYQRLVFQDKLADAVSVSVSPLALAGLFQISVDVREGVEPARAEAVVREELARFLADGPTDEELARARISRRADFVRSMEKVGGKAEILAEGQLYRGDPAAYRHDLERADAATPAGVKAAADTWLARGDYLLTVLPVRAGGGAAAKGERATARGPLPGRPAAQLPAEQAYATRASEVDRRAGVPRVATFPSLTFPALARGRLRNGIEVIVAQHRAIPTTLVQVMFDAGYAGDPAGKPGTASFTAAMMRSTRQLDAIAVARRMQGLGASTQVACDLDSCTASLDALNEQLQPALALFADLVRDPVFESDDLERIRNQLLAGIALEKTLPRAIAARILPSLLYGPNHAYGASFTGSGTEASIRAIRAADLAAYRDNWLRPDNATILVVGDTSLQEIVPRLDAVFGDWSAPAAPLPRKALGVAAAPAGARVLLVDKPGAPQSSIFAGLLAPSSAARDAIAADVANGAFGGNFSSRLNLNLRENKHWSYGASSRLQDAVGQRLFLISAPVQTDKTAASLREIVTEARDVVGARPLTPAEVELARQFVVRGLPGRYETSADVLDMVSRMVRYGYPDTYANTLKDTVEAVDAKAAEAALHAFIVPDAMTWVVVGDLRRIERPVRALKLGEVEVVDADGKPAGARPAAARARTPRAE
ncbi:insulinase family protein [Burkholderia sp. FERM BP-3421]|uniref:M16 family metallopeptidase n=1 Tax=Burkholderia sp. FERM BP-3421 TaxID=1494466 RepID=UPI00235E6447|nr:pitrilysin family protein [Burkholderia sp. FERM BP-3421]WDD91499.1 insulinase family protein [Burkholderia sp. FERM BP-3421]